MSVSRWGAATEPITFTRSDNGPLYKTSRTFERNNEEPCTILIKIDKDEDHGEWALIGPFPGGANYEEIRSGIAKVSKEIQEVEEYCKNNKVPFELKGNGIYLLKFVSNSPTSAARITIDPDPGGGKVP